MGTHHSESHRRCSEAPIPLNCIYCHSRRNEDGSPVVDSNAHWLGGVCGAPGCAAAGLLRHTQGCAAAANLIDAGLTESINGESENYADLEGKRSSDGSPRCNAFTINRLLRPLPTAVTQLPQSTTPSARSRSFFRPHP